MASNPFFMAALVAAKQLQEVDGRFVLDLHGKRYVIGVVDNDIEELAGVPCVYCGNPSEGNYGFSAGEHVVSNKMPNIYLALCDKHGESAHPSIEEILERMYTRLAFIGGCNVCGSRKAPYVVNNMSHSGFSSIELPGAFVYEFEGLRLCDVCHQVASKEEVVDRVLENYIERAIPMPELRMWRARKDGSPWERVLSPVESMDEFEVVKAADTRLQDPAGFGEKCARARSLLQRAGLEE